MVTATMLTEATGPLAERDYPTLRAHTGTAPVTKRSGKRAFFVQMRYACKPACATLCIIGAKSTCDEMAPARRAAPPGATRLKRRSSTRDLQSENLRVSASPRLETCEVTCDT